MTLKKHIPNCITLLNLLSGCIAILFAVHDNLIAAVFFVFLGIFFDFFDGLAARLLNVQSDLGIQLDSLADLVSSGVVPGIIMYKLIELSEGNWIHFETTQFNTETVLQVFNLPLLGLLIPLASAYRLAKFNIDEDQQTYFKGLPVPANTILILALPLILEFQNSDAINALIVNKWFLIGLTLLSCYLLNASFKLFALKFKNWSFKSNSIRYIFLILSIVLSITLKFIAIPLIILLYIALSLSTQKQIH